MLHEMPQVTVAAINGACAGAGLGWACGCDLRYAARSAKLNTAFLDVAVAGDMGLPWTLPRIVGAGKARELSLLPRKLSADEAAAIGLVNAAFDDDTFRDDVAAIVAELAAKAPIARRGMKQHYVAAESMGFGEFIAIETKDHGTIIASEDCGEAFRAFVEKRTPNFQGDRMRPPCSDCARSPSSPATTSWPPRSSSTPSASRSPSTTPASRGSGCTTR